MFASLCNKQYRDNPLILGTVFYSIFGEKYLLQLQQPSCDKKCGADRSKLFG